ncbi:MAG: peptide chain release factor N(5)-glutamine methyltransferase [Candidatus Omnitrophica bacterium]|nr:peptide chain release factor N(5)-glutamine methyltransferase [Candidatus Omnitrophota bacterium]
MNADELLLTAVRKCRRVDLYADPRPLTPEEQQTCDAMRARYQNGEPLQYVLGECDFLGNTLAVDPSVMIPRTETEILVDTIVQKLRANKLSKPCRILDLGTGSGNIAIALAKAIEGCLVTALDISEDAIAVAKRNAEVNGVAQRIEFLREDMRASLVANRAWIKNFDCIVSNPPYIKTSALAHLPADVRQEPRLALDGGSDGLRFYEAIIRRACQYLKPEGYLFFEIGDDQAAAVKAFLTQNPFYRNVCFYPDHTQTDRVVCAQTAKVVCSQTTRVVCEQKDEHTWKS